MASPDFSFWRGKRDESDAISKASVAEVRQAVEEAIHSSEELQSKERAPQEIEVFKALHPEYVDSKSNARLLVHRCEQMFGTKYVSAQQYEDVLYDLRASGAMLDINTGLENKREVEKRVGEVKKQREANDFDFQRAVNGEMPLEELRDKCFEADRAAAQTTQRFRG
jgi:hypothetical protein